MGMASWRAVARETGRCPFTQQAISLASITRVTPFNLDALRPRLRLPQSQGRMGEA